MNYGFIIDNRKCIGCHACSTACKSENEVPLGVSRTWVKYTEVGRYPDVKRHFQVTRCNHCENPPCVRICPVTAMYQRDDGIVEFDKNVCIGCKACMQACPYDAIYLDPESNTAAKCHYCSHRVEVGVEPACVVVCPEHAIIAGDLDDPDSEISRTLAKNSVTVRRPEQGTGPKTFYIDGHGASLSPSTSMNQDEAYLWSENVSEHARQKPAKKTSSKATMGTSRTASSGTPIRDSSKQGLAASGPMGVQGKVAEQMVQVAYNASHKIPWHWQVPAYLVTKGIASGSMLFLTACALLGLVQFDAISYVTTSTLAVVFTLATTGLLIADLAKPLRFMRIVFRPQMKSWLARGAFILIAFSGIATIWWLLEIASVAELGFTLGDGLRTTLLVAGIPLAIGTSVYTAFLFGQAEGRDLWQNPLLPFHLLVQSILTGTAGMLVVNFFAPLSFDILSATKIGFIAALWLDLALIFLGEYAMPHQSDHATRAAKEIKSGLYRNHFWWGAIVVGHIAALALMLGPVSAWSVAGLAAIVGTYFYEHAFVMAPQKIANS